MIKNISSTTSYGLTPYKRFISLKQNYKTICVSAVPFLSTSGQVSKIIVEKKSLKIKEININYE